MAEELTRRSFMRIAGVTGLGLAAGGIMGLAGCGGSQAASNSASQASTSSAPSSSSSSATTSSSASSAASSAQATGAAAVVFYSRAGENYQVGTVEEGNTAKVAKEIAAQTGATLVEIEPEQTYPDGYDECCDVAQAEQDANARPALKSIPDLSSYDTVYLGYPIWWGDLPMLMYTLIEATDWAGKVIAPFNTHEGSGVSGTNASIAKACEGADVKESLALRGKTAQESPDEVKQAVTDWLASLA